MSMTVEVVVVGVGVMGAATGRALARRGRKVVMLEQFHVGHTSGSSHGTSRYRQLAAHPTTEYLELGLRARQLWDDLQKETATTILHRTGNVSLGQADELQRQASALAAHNIECELASGAEMAERWPQLSLPKNKPVLYQPDGEVIAADRAVEAFLSAAKAAGAELRENSKVSAVEENSTGGVVRTADDVIEADRVVLTPGPWAKPLAASVGIDLPVTVSRQTVAYFRPPDFVPPTITDFGGTEPYSLWDPVHGLKAAEHHRGPTADPDTKGTIDEASAARVAEWVQSLFPTAGAEPHRLETCLYTNAPDDHIIIERHGRIVVASPCSGQGFQFSPTIGEQLAALTCE
jgi:monomeric sarcosine oxidase